MRDDAIKYKGAQQREKAIHRRETTLVRPISEGTIDGILANQCRYKLLYLYAIATVPLYLHLLGLSDPRVG